MSFAETYLSRYASRQVESLPIPDQDLFFSIVIPAFNEPDLIASLRSLLSADPPDVHWEIIIVVNEPRDCSSEKHNQNIRTIEEVIKFRKDLKRQDLQIHLIIPDPFPGKKAGPGMARKIGMDESVRRFNYLKRPEGIIISYDADTTCSSNYLREIHKFFSREEKAGGCTISYEHRLEEEYYSSSIHRNAIIQYELFLRYFKLALEWISYPYAVHALGSAFAVRAQRYVLAGGMGLQQAGEDFYFLQKCIPHSNFWELNATMVYPSGRTSDRVPFGTGPFVANYINEGKEAINVFPFELFRSLHPLFRWAKMLKEKPSSMSEIDMIIKALPVEIYSRFIALGWRKKIQTALEESAGLIPFRKRFYHEISILQLIHLFNDLSQGEFPKLPIIDEFSCLLDALGHTAVSRNTIDLLFQARKIESLKEKRRIS